jgi:dihydrofolate reductase
MTVALIAALARNRTIGCRGQLPWHLPEDLQRFKAITLGHVLLMGRATFDSIGRPLPGRRTIVVTRQPAWHVPGVEVARTIEDAFEKAHEETVFVAGGGEVFRQTIDRASCLYLTCIDRDVDGDAFFPEFEQADFRVLERQTFFDRPLPFEFLTLQRK